MADYVARSFQENSFLDHPLPEREFIAAMAAHFSREIERKLRVSLIKTVSQLIEILDEIETSQARMQQRGQARQGEYAKTGDVTNFRETDRVNKRPEPPARREPVGRPSENNRRLLSSPPPVRPTTLRSRDDYVRRFPQRFDDRTGPNKRVVNFKASAPVKNWVTSKKTVSVIERQGLRDNSSGEVLPEERLEDRA